MSIKYELKVKNGTYKKDGQDKNKYVKIGVAMENEKGMYIMLDKHINLAGFPNDGKNNLMVSCFEPKKYDGTSSKPDYTSGLPDDQDIPF